MNEIISLYGQAFHAAPEQPRRKSLISLRRIVAALLWVFASLGLIGLAGWLVYSTLLIERRANEGDIEAQYRLGKRNLGAAISSQDRAEALRWIQRAAEAGQVDAQRALGCWYARQNSSPQDLKSSLVWFRKAAIQGDILAQNELAARYATGRGVSRDFSKAIRWYTLAAAGGSRLAKANLELVQSPGARSLGNLTTRTGNRYSNAALRAVESDGIMIAYESVQGSISLTKVKRDDLPEKLRQLCKYSSTTNSPGDRLAPWL